MQMELEDDLPMSASLRLEWAESAHRKPVIVSLSAHQFSRTFPSSFKASATGKAAMIEDKLQQTKPGPPPLQMTPVSQAYAQSRVEIFDQRAAAWCAAQRLGYGGVDVVKRAADAGKQAIPSLPERARRFGLAVQDADLAHESARHVVRSRNGVEFFVEQARESEQSVALVLQCTADRRVRVVIPERVRRAGRPGWLRGPRRR
jgi:hypothetical protein